MPGAANGDDLTFLWNLWWAREAAQAGSSFFTTPYLMHPYGASLVLHTHIALPAWVGATVLGALPLVATYNTIVLAAYALNGWLAYWLALRLTRDWSAALAAGVAFEMAPYFAAHVTGHLNLINAWMLPLGALGLVLVLEGRRVAGGMVLAAAVAAAGYTDYYALVFLGGLSVVIAAGTWWRATVGLRPKPTDGLQIAAGGVAVIAAATAVVVAVTGGVAFRLAGLDVSMQSGLNLRTIAWMAVLWLAWRRWRPTARVTQARPRAVIVRDAIAIAAAWLVAVVVLAPIVTAGVTLVVSGQYVAPPIRWRSSAPGIDVATLLMGQPFHPVWGGWWATVYQTLGVDLPERTATLGLVPLAMIVMRRRHLTAQDATRVWVGVLVVFGVWACGPYLAVAGANTGLLLPGILLQAVPIVSNARILSRAFVLVHLAVAILLALALTTRTPRSSSANLWVAALLGLELLAAPVPTSQIVVPAVYRMLATMPAGAVLELPVGYRDGFGERGWLAHETLAYQTVHRKPLVGGFVARLPPSLVARYEQNPFMRRLLDLSTAPPLAGVPTSCDAGGLDALDVRYVILDRARATPALQRFVVSCVPLRPIAGDGRRTLFERVGIAAIGP